MEIAPASTGATAGATGATAAAKPFYNYDFSFAYPYVMLCVDGFDNMYDGTNDSVRRAFCMFVFHRAYKAPNGRGYVVLQAAQNERMWFKTPLASLRDVRIAIEKPNGTLLNNSVDDYTVSAFEYNAQNRLYLKVVCDRYFDENEYFQGDAITIRGFRLAPASPTTPGAQYFSTLNDFVGRPSGHEIVQLGKPNDQGFYKTFYILAPGVLDQGAGRVIIDANLVGVVQLMATAGVTVLESPGRLVNASLQNVLSLRAGVQVFQ